MWRVDGVINCDCGSPSGRTHSDWTCRNCGAQAAEGCLDVTQWGSAYRSVYAPAHVAIPTW